MTFLSPSHLTDPSGLCSGNKMQQNAWKRGTLSLGAGSSSLRRWTINTGNIDAVSVGRSNRGITPLFLRFTMRVAGKYAAGSLRKPKGGPQSRRTGSRARAFPSHRDAWRAGKRGVLEDRNASQSLLPLAIQRQILEASGQSRRQPSRGKPSIEACGSGPQKANSVANQFGSKEFCHECCVD